MAARATALYPDAGRNIAYPTLGLAGEAAETFEKIVNNADTKDVLAELGDVLWYTANLAWEAGLTLAGEYDDTAFPRVETDGVASRIKTGNDLVIAVGHVCEIVKKTMRDAGGVFDEHRTSLLQNQLVEVLSAASKVAFAYGGDLTAAAENNVAKLASRADRGVIHGNGDNR